MARSIEVILHEVIGGLVLAHAQLKAETEMQAEKIAQLELTIVAMNARTPPTHRRTKK